ncbi:MAG: hypothetical protein WAM42_04675 [Candidatus Nitrosopolaris sp.]|jgi:hypothetical protein
MTIIAIGWTRGNKKALVTILPTEYWDRLRDSNWCDNSRLYESYLQFTVGVRDRKVAVTRMVLIEIRNAE